MLDRRLRSVSADEIASFDEIWISQFHRLYAWPTWDAGMVMLGWFGDDSFRDFRAWIITHGQAAVSRVIKDPDNLVDLAWDRENAFVESFDGLVYRAYLAVTGHEPPQDGPHALLDPTGECVDVRDEAAVRVLFPRLAAFRDANPSTPEQQAAAAPQPDPTERCPGCGNALTLRSANRAHVSGDGPPQCQYRRCVGCGQVATRAMSVEGWAAWTIADVNLLDQGMAFMVSKLLPSTEETAVNIAGLSGAR